MSIFILGATRNGCYTRRGMPSAKTSTAIDRPRFACITHGLNPQCTCKLYDLSREAERINCRYARRRAKHTRSNAFLLGPPFSLFVAGCVVGFHYGFSPGVILMWGSTLCIILGLLGGAIERFTRSDVTKKLDSHLNQLE